MRIVDRGTVFDGATAPPAARFCTFTSLEVLSDGRMLVACRRARTKDSSDEDVFICMSEDGGAVWHPVFEGFGTYQIDGVVGRFRNALITEVRPGLLMVHLCWIDHSDPALPMANPQTQGLLPVKLFVADSTDCGRTWHNLREVPLLPHKASVSTGELLVLQDGTLVLPYETFKEYYDTRPGKHRAALRFSNDGGTTWTGPAVVAHDDQEQRILYWDQRIAMHPRTGRLIAMIWTHDRDAEQDLEIHVAQGSSDGRVWEPAVSTGVAGQIAAPLVLPDGRVFAAYVHRHDPPGLRGILSDDFGRSWTAAQELVLYSSPAGAESGMDTRRNLEEVWEDMGRWTFGHPACRNLPDGGILVAYYAGDQTALGIHWVRIDPA